MRPDRHLVAGLRATSRHAQLPHDLPVCGIRLGPLRRAEIHGRRHQGQCRTPGRAHHGDPGHESLGKMRGGARQGAGRKDQNPTKSRRRFGGLLPTPWPLRQWCRDKVACEMSIVANTESYMPEYVTEPDWASRLIPMPVTDGVPVEGRTNLDARQPLT